MGASHSLASAHSLSSSKFSRSSFNPSCFIFYFFGLFHIRFSLFCFTDTFQTFESKILMFVSSKCWTIYDSTYNTFTHMSLADRIGTVIILLSNIFNPFTSADSIIIRSASKKLGTLTPIVAIKATVLLTH